MNKVNIGSFLTQFFEQSPDQRIKKTLYILAIMFVLIVFYKFEANKQIEDPSLLSEADTSSQPFYQLEHYYEDKVKEVLESTQFMQVSHVLINFKSTAVTTYLTEEQTDVNRQNQTNSDGSTDSQVNEAKQTEIVMKEVDRKRQPIAYKTEKPDVQGVLVVISGQESIEIKRKCIELVAKYLAVSPHRVAVQFKGG